MSDYPEAPPLLAPPGQQQQQQQQQHPPPPHVLAGAATGGGAAFTTRGLPAPATGAAAAAALAEAPLVRPGMDATAPEPTTPTTTPTTTANVKRRRRTAIVDDENPFLPSRQSCLNDRFQRSFNDMLYELLRFRLQKGHTRVPSTYGTLGIWVYRLRVQYQAWEKHPHQQRNHSTQYRALDLTHDRIEVLDSLEFVWDLFRYQSDQVWNDRYEELVHYKQLHGHCNVPQTTPGELGKWVKHQRDYYSNLQHGRLHRAGTLTDDKIERLNALGFEWRLIQMVGWDQRFAELCEFKRLHGHTNVPTQTSGALGRWVSKQRIHMTYRKKGDYSQLSDERIDKLNSIGFVWNTKATHSSGDQELDGPAPYLYDALQV